MGHTLHDINRVIESIKYNKTYCCAGSDLNTDILDMLQEYFMLLETDLEISSIPAEVIGCFPDEDELSGTIDTLQKAKGLKKKDIIGKISIALEQLELIQTKFCQTKDHIKDLLKEE